MATKLSLDDEKILSTLYHDYWRLGNLVFVSPSLIGKKCGRAKSGEHFRWASTRCTSLRTRGLVERNDRGYYRLTEKGASTIWG